MYASLTAHGRTLLPGLIDAHAHIWNESQLRQAEAFGTTTVLDMFSDRHFVQQAKAELTAGKLMDGADLYSAGTLATAPGGHATEYGSAETLRARVVAAGKLAAGVVVHVGALADAEAAPNAGADGLMHLFIDREPDAGFGQLAAEHHALEVRIPLSAFNSSDGDDVQALLFDGGTAPGAFQFAIDEVRLVAR
jgi:hypothetical protein